MERGFSNHHERSASHSVKSNMKQPALPGFSSGSILLASRHSGGPISPRHHLRTVERLEAATFDIVMSSTSQSSKGDGMQLQMDLTHCPGGQASQICTDERRVVTLGVR